ncbi:DUF5372 family protein [Candidatus Rariloculus sp.]|uniref:DUF5372 family protein n=1 Tax=Candidatus Rariloculus sp. TaxID=3101265 RepID=UPI003D0EAC6B
MYTATTVIAQGADHERVMFRDELDYLRHMPAHCTDFAEPDPFPAISDGRSAFRVVDLLALADLLSGLEAAGSAPDV